MNESRQAQIRSLAVKGFHWHQNAINAQAPLENLDNVVDLGAFAKLAASIEKNKTVIVTFLSAEYLQVGSAWLTAMKCATLRNYIVITGDWITSKAMAARDEPHIEASLHLLSDGDSYISPAGFTLKGLAMTTLKFPVVLFLLRQGYSVLLSDIDALWLKNPLPYLNQSAAVAFQRVVYFPAAIAQAWSFAACSGFAFFRSTPGTDSLISDCIRLQLEVHSDQLAFNLALLDANLTWPSLATRSQRPVLARATPQLLKEFRASAQLTIGGEVNRYDIDVLALSHHKFWRHEFVSPVWDNVLICHPNSPKTDAGKILCFQKLGILT